MESILSTVDARTYSAAQYAALPREERDRLADGLLCPSCRADAFFIRQARNGRAACFGARPHIAGCELVAQSTEDRGTRALRVAPSVWQRSESSVSCRCVIVLSVTSSTTTVTTMRVAAVTDAGTSCPPMRRHSTSESPTERGAATAVRRSRLPPLPRGDRPRGWNAHDSGGAVRPLV